MATTAKKKQQPNKEMLLEKYSDYVLKHSKQPANVYAFMSDLGYEESEFYKHFSGFDSLENEFLKHFFGKAQQLVMQMPAFESMPSREKLLNLYFVFVENLTLNRSLVRYLLAPKTTLTMKRILALRNMHHDFVRNLTFDSMALFPDDLKVARTAQQVATKAKEELLWAHFLSVIEFWRNDRSKSFESTDIYIEKSIDTGFEIVNLAPLQKMVDIGKFLWKERFQTAR